MDPGSYTGPLPVYRCRAEMARERPRKNVCRAKEEGVRPQSGMPPLAGRINIVYQDKRISGISGYFDRRLFGTQRPSEGQVNTSTQSSFYFGKESHGSSFVNMIVQSPENSEHLSFRMYQIRLRGPR